MVDLRSYYKTETSSIRSRDRRPVDPAIGGTMEDGGTCLPDDVLVQIFLLVPARSRRPLRLVCKGWRDVIDERAPPPVDDKLPTKILVFINQGRRSSAVVFDGGSRHRTRERTYTSSRDGGRVRMVGTCNGLLCLHDHSTTYAGFSISTITVTNPVTGETAALPPVPRRWAWAQLAKAPGHYSFGFHPETKLHKVVYIPRGHRWSLDALQVFTLGSKAWRAVPVHVRGACHDLLCEPISVAGTTYWLAAGRVMALDLGPDERVTSLDAPPAKMVRPAPSRPATRKRRDTSWRLTKVGTSLGVVVPSAGMFAGRVDVWVLDVDGGGEKKPLQWSRRYSIAEYKWGSWVMAPQLTHGNYVLSAEHEWGFSCSRVYRHEVGELVDGGDDDWQRQLPPVKGVQLIMSKEEREGELTTFAYVETWNPVPRSK
ncbi:unnamed protein product [Urochloa decumbens]|uniref:F-box domain-containing protein n=1 Tax=Urochloa decumbens TaxID=240449 RepID=A0ABC9BQY8_9POAL